MKSYRTLLTSTLLGVTLVTAILITGCDFQQTQKKPEVGPTGPSEEAKANPHFWQRFEKPPQIFYDLEPLSGNLFENLKKDEWEQAALQLTALRQAWENIKVQIGDKKGVAEADDALEKINQSIIKQNRLQTYESLNKFFSATSEVAKSYKLSPLSDIFEIGNATRNVNYYVIDKDWSKAAAKAQELEQTWEQNKPGLEMIGILGKVTQTHSTIKALRDAVGGENQGKAESQLKSLNESLGSIREFYKNK